MGKRRGSQPGYDSLPASPYEIRENEYYGVISVHIPDDILGLVMNHLELEDIITCKKVSRKWRVVAQEVCEEREREGVHQPCFIDRLSPELLQEIFHQLSPVDFYSCRMVCKRWKILSNSTMLLRHHIKALGPHQRVRGYSYHRDKHRGNPPQLEGNFNVDDLAREFLTAIPRSRSVPFADLCRMYKHQVSVLDLQSLIRPTWRNGTQHTHAYLCELGRFFVVSDIFEAHIYTLSEEVVADPTEQGSEQHRIYSGQGHPAHLFSIPISKEIVSITSSQDPTSCRNDLGLLLLFADRTAKLIDIGKRKYSTVVGDGLDGQGQIVMERVKADTKIAEFRNLCHSSAMVCVDIPDMLKSEGPPPHVVAMDYTRKQVAFGNTKGIEVWMLRPKERFRKEKRGSLVPEPVWWIPLNFSPLHLTIGSFTSGALLNPNSQSVIVPWYRESGEFRDSAGNSYSGHWVYPLQSKRPTHCREAKVIEDLHNPVFLTHIPHLRFLEERERREMVVVTLSPCRTQLFIQRLKTRDLSHLGTAACDIEARLIVGGEPEHYLVPITQYISIRTGRESYLIAARFSNDVIYLFDYHHQSQRKLHWEGAPQHTTTVYGTKLTSILSGGITNMSFITNSPPPVASKNGRIVPSEEGISEEGRFKRWVEHTQEFSLAVQTRTGIRVYGFGVGGVKWKRVDVGEVARRVL